MPLTTKPLIVSAPHPRPLDLVFSAPQRANLFDKYEVIERVPEAVAADHPARSLKGFIRSAHRAGALDSAFKKMGGMVLEDMALMDQGLPPMHCKRAERETVSRVRSKPVIPN